MVPGLQMTSNVFTIIHDMELGKSHVLPVTGRNFARNNNGTGDIGNGKKSKWHLVMRCIEVQNLP
ncbi:hypothetical protein [uncultured Methanomethylovorans sp.]|uniref:hypothetical protein n=1 Tax=uncultured Methanomethylovorans sp. TaxID=183759 RepID=UPI002AA79601|nr:hypothetical protein [uncultured Methanomethylovorans sp.]